MILLGLIDVNVNIPRCLCFMLLMSLGSNLARLFISAIEEYKI